MVITLAVSSTVLVIGVARDDGMVWMLVVSLIDGETVVIEVRDTDGTVKLELLCLLLPESCVDEKSDSVSDFCCWDGLESIIWTRDGRDSLGEEADRLSDVCDTSEPGYSSVPCVPKVACVAWEALWWCCPTRYESRCAL